MSFCTPSSLWGARCSSGSLTTFAESASVKRVSRSGKTESDQDTIAKLNLESVKRSLIEKLSWNKKMVERAEKEYREFLLLNRDAPKLGIVPWSDDLDTFWHQHILDTEKYAKDCDAIFGHFLHHNPNVSDKTRHFEAIRRTKRLVAQRNRSKI